MKNAILKVADTEGVFCRFFPLVAVSVNKRCVFLPIGASLFTCGNLGPVWYLCVAVKTRVIIYEVNKTKLGYEKKKVGLYCRRHVAMYLYYLLVDPEESGKVDLWLSRPLHEWIVT